MTRAIRILMVSTVSIPTGLYGVGLFIYGAFEMGFGFVEFAKEVK